MGIRIWRNFGCFGHRDSQEDLGAKIRSTTMPSVPLPTRSNPDAAKPDTIMPMQSKDMTANARMWVYVGDEAQPYSLPRVSRPRRNQCAGPEGPRACAKRFGILEKLVHQRSPFTTECQENADQTMPGNLTSVRALFCRNTKQSGIVGGLA